MTSPPAHPVLSDVASDLAVAAFTLARRFADGATLWCWSPGAPEHAPGRYRVTGNVAFRGVSRSCEDEITIEPVDDRTIRLEGRSTFDIRDFGMEAPRILLLKVEPDVRVRVEIHAEREGAT